MTTPSDSLPGDRSGEPPSREPDIKPFTYLLNAMEVAAWAEKPSERGYEVKRKAVFDYVREALRAARGGSPPDEGPTVPLEWLHHALRMGAKGDALSCQMYVRKLSRRVAGLEDLAALYPGNILRGGGSPAGTKDITAAVDAQQREDVLDDYPELRAAASGSARPPQEEEK